MKKLPDLLPSYTIEESDKTPFAVKWEELMGVVSHSQIGGKTEMGYIRVSIPEVHADL